MNVIAWSNDNLIVCRPSEVWNAWDINLNTSFKTRNIQTLCSKTSDKEIKRKRERERERERERYLDYALNVGYDADM